MPTSPAVHVPPTVRERQELLNLAGIPVAIDGQDGPLTRFALDAFHEVFGGEAIDADFVALAEEGPFVSVDATLPLSRVALELAGWYLTAGAREVGGNNRGPWVRQFLGADGPGCEWCAGFLWCAVVPAAERALNEARTAAGLAPLDIARTLRSASCTTVHGYAARTGRLVTDWRQARPGMGYLLPRDGAWHHTGIVEVVGPDGLLLTIEGNANEPSDPGRSDRVARHIRDARALGLHFVTLD